MEATASYWAKIVATLRRRAEQQPLGPERDRLLEQAERLDTAIDIADMLAIKSRKPARR